MRFNDTVLGAVLLAFAITVMLHVSVGWSWLVATEFDGFPRAVPGRPGPALFPFTLGALFAVCAVILLVRGQRSKGPLFQAQEWLSRPASVLNAIGVLAAILAYILWAEVIGFLPLSTVLLLLLMLQLGVRPIVAALTAVGMSLFIHSLFVKFLLVPLPWGLLDPIAW